MPTVHEELAAAMAAERAAWARVKDKLPGSPGYDAVLWEHWRETISRCHALRAGMRIATAGGAGVPAALSPGAAEGSKRDG